MEFVKIVLTGGPCAGKTTALSLIPEYFERLGWHVIIVPEIATQTMLAGIRTEDFSSSFEFEALLVRNQYELEQSYMTYARLMLTEKILMVCDRGVCDCRAYTDEAQYLRALSMIGIDKFGSGKVRDEWYDAVFHLVTAADGAREFYTKSNNAARLEDVEEAIEADYRTQNVWVGHPHLRIIGNSGSFDDKMHTLLAEISNFLGEPEPFEIERKFLIKLPNVSLLREMPNCQEAEILQTYLTSEDGAEERIRQRGRDGGYTFTHTIKRPTDDPAKRIETERRIDRDEYLRLLMRADPRLHPVRKTRFCVLQRESEQYLEIDLYPGAQKYAVLEVELRSAKDEVVFPDFLEVVREVTVDGKYRNHSIAGNGGFLPE